MSKKIFANNNPDAYAIVDDDVAEIIQEMKLKFVENAGQCWKWISMWCMTIDGAIQSAWLFVPDDLKASISPDNLRTLTIALMVFGVIGRLVDQKSSVTRGDQL